MRLGKIELQFSVVGLWYFDKMTSRVQDAEG
jgi:hypothetical protein